jgi:hypothetical protein
MSGPYEVEANEGPGYRHQLLEAPFETFSRDRYSFRNPRGTHEDSKPIKISESGRELGPARQYPFDLEIFGKYRAR